MKRLTAPKRIRGPLVGGGARTRLDERRKFIERAAADGYTVEQVAKAVGISPNTLYGNFRSLFAPRPTETEAPVSKPATDRTTMVIRSGGALQEASYHTRISLPRAPWEGAEIAPDPRHETAPRHRGLVGSPIRHVTEEDVMAVLMRAEVRA